MASNTNAERWAPVPGYEGYYEASSLGRIRSKTRKVNSRQGPITLKSRIMSQSGIRYQKVTLSKEGGQRTPSVHMLVALSFLGEPPGPIGRRDHEWQVNHKNGIITDNRLANLEWCLGAKNKAHAVENGLTLKGSDNPASKLTEAKVREIRRRHSRGGVTCKIIAEDHGVSAVLISQIVRRVAWQHVE